MEGNRALLYWQGSRRTSKMKAIPSSEQAVIVLSTKEYCYLFRDSASGKHRQFDNPRTVIFLRRAALRVNPKSQSQNLLVLAVFPAAYWVCVDSLHHAQRLASRALTYQVINHSMQSDTFPSHQGSDDFLTPLGIWICVNMSFPVLIPSCRAAEIPLCLWSQVRFF